MAWPRRWQTRLWFLPKAALAAQLQKKNSSLVEEESSSLLEADGLQRECQDECVQVNDCIQVNECMQESIAPILNPTLLTSLKVCQGKGTSKGAVTPEKEPLAPRKMYDSTERREYYAALLEETLGGLEETLKKARWMKLWHQSRCAILAKVLCWAILLAAPRTNV